MNTPSYFFKILRQYGLREILRKSFRKYLYRKEVQLIMEKDLRSGKIKFGRAKRSNLPDQVKVLSYPEDHAAMHRAHPGRARGLRNWISQGAEPLGVIIDGELVGMQVITTGTYREDHFNYTFNLPEDTGLLFAGWLSPAYRRSTITADTLNVCFDHLLNRGAVRAITCVDTENIKSIKILLHIEFKETGRQLIIHRLLGFCWTRCVTYQGKKLVQFARPRNKHKERDYPEKSYGT